MAEHPTTQRSLNGLVAKQLLAQVNEEQQTESLELSTVEPHEKCHNFSSHALDRVLLLLKDAQKSHDGCTFIDDDAMKYYKFYNNKWISTILVANLFVLFSLSYFEFPSFQEASVYVTGSIELGCLCILKAELLLRYLCFRKRFIRNKWSWTKAIMILLNIVDIVYTFITDSPYVRPTRLLRCIYIIDYSSHTHMLFRNLARTIAATWPLVIGILFYVALYAVFGRVIFPNNPYFNNFFDAFLNMFFCLTTVTFPDMFIPSYTQAEALCSIFFVSYLSLWLFIGLPLTISFAVQYLKTSLQHERASKAELSVAAIGAAFQILDVNGDGHINSNTLVELLEHILVHVNGSKGGSSSRFVQTVLLQASKLLDKDADEERWSLNLKEFTTVFNTLLLDLVVEKDAARSIIERIIHPLKVTMETPCLARLFDIRGVLGSKVFQATTSALILCNAVVIIARAESVSLYHPEWLFVLDTLLLAFFLVEVFLKATTPNVGTFGWKLFDVVLIACSLASKVVLEFIMKNDTIEIVLFFSALRLLRSVSVVDRLRLMVESSIFLISTLLYYSGVIFVFYYMFAIMGMLFFNGVLVRGNPKLLGTDYDKNGYYDMIHFNSFHSAMVSMFHLHVMNNWNVTLKAVLAATNGFSCIFFLAFYFVTTLSISNIITAVVLKSIKQVYGILGHTTATTGMIRVDTGYSQLDASTNKT